MAGARVSRCPRIGITTSQGGGRYMWYFYWLAMQLLRFTPIRLTAPVDRTRFDALDGFIIGGGDDVGAELYEGVPTLDVRIDPARDKMELAALEYAFPRELPVLGVCRGVQMLNVFMGGNLHQDVRAVFNDVPVMWSPLPRKTAYFVEGTKLQRILDLNQLRVNSLHRQAIDRLGAGLIISAIDQYGIVQAVEDPKADFCIGVQWHPEFLMYQASQRRVFRAFSNAVERRRGEQASS